MYLARVAAVRLLVAVGEWFLKRAVRVAGRGWFEVFVDVRG
jgi:hypothetical protein